MWRMLIITVTIIMVIIAVISKSQSVTEAAGDRGNNTKTTYYLTNTTRHYASIHNNRNIYNKNDNNNNSITDTFLNPPNCTHRSHSRSASERHIEHFCRHVKVASDQQQHVFPPKASDAFERHLEETSIVFALVKAANASLLNPSCYTALRHIERSTLEREPWAMKVLDASGTKPSGFIFGQNFWLGSREACGAVSKPIGITLSKDYQRNMNRGLIEDLSPFDMDYRVLYLRHNSPWQVEIKLMSERIIHIGLCLPTACSATEIQALAQACVQQRRFVDLTDVYDAHAHVLYMKDLKLNESFYQKRSLKLFVAFMTFTCAMMLSASILRVKPAAAVGEKQLKQKDSEVESTIDAEVESTIAPRGSDETRSEFLKSTHDDSSENLKRFIRCYDVSANCTRLFATRQHSASEIPVINGLRSISALWIMLFHVLWYMYFTVDNKPFLISHAERVFFQYVSSAPLLVDVFFTISGFLQTYNFMRNTQLMERIRSNSLEQNVRHFFQILLHRYLRLAPLYFVIMGVVDLLSAYIHDVSVFHIHDRFDEICSQYWWRNVIFIQNLFNHEEMCVNWTWSLACEMQFFILATMLLFVYAKHPGVVKLTVLTALTATICWSFISGMAAKFQLSFDVTFATGTQIYINPFVRILPYIMGTIAGWYFIERRHSVVIDTLSPLREKCLWNLAIVIFFSCIYSTFRRDISYFSSISLFTIGRLLFSLAVCWMIIGSATGRGSWWSRILEARLFQHVNRLTYAIYLLNPFIIALFFSMAERSTHVDPLMLCVLASGFAVIVYLASIVFSLAFEMPYCNWSSLMLKRRKTQKLV